MFFILLMIEIAGIITGAMLLGNQMELYGWITLGVSITLLILTILYYSLRDKNKLSNDCGNSFLWFGDCDCDGPKGFDCDGPDCDCSP